jgi:hypothetical protein
MTRRWFDDALVAGFARIQNLAGGLNSGESSYQNHPCTSVFHPWLFIDDIGSSFQEILAACERQV